ncbi:MAG TPA: serine hydrolase domain-containing protein [Kofleriaceae bacterium]|nr:serine hydrolase domain-containing protein [Kofleriaceae bacterium]
MWLALVIVLGGGVAPAAPAPPAVLDRFIAGYATDHAFSGTILVEKQGKVSYAHSFGLASRALRVPNTAATRYKIASITKAFTSVLILQLRDQGKLDLGETIKTYLPGYTGPGADKVTIHQLLDHTSGIDNFDKVKSAADAIEHGVPVYQAPYTTDELLHKFCSGPLVHAPGTTFDYNNADYIILGKIIEQRHGKPYEQVLQERILDPLHLTGTGVLHQRDIVADLADTYFLRDDKVLVNDLPGYPENWYAAGAMYSTVEDLRVFANALFGGKLLSAESLALMIKPGLDHYGYGVWTYDTTIRGTTYHVVKRPGRIMGAQSQLYHVMTPDITVIILSNQGTTDLDEFVAEIGKRTVS